MTVARNHCDASRKARERSNRNVVVTQRANRFQLCCHELREPGMALFFRAIPDRLLMRVLKSVDQPTIEQEK
jgi:hypothetical protein